MRECDSTGLPVFAVVIIVVTVVVELFTFPTLSLKNCRDLLQILYGCFLVGPLQHLLSWDATPIFHGNLGNFLQFSDNS